MIVVPRITLEHPLHSETANKTGIEQVVHTEAWIECIRTIRRCADQGFVVVSRPQVDLSQIDSRRVNAVP